MTLDVCVPCFNGGRYLEDCLASVARQTRLPRRLLFFDNGSGDRSAAIAGSFAAKHPVLPFEFFRASAPGGMANDWNRAVSESDADLVLLLPCDDLLVPDALHRHCYAHASSEITFSAGQKILIGPSGREWCRPMARIRGGTYSGCHFVRWLAGRAENSIGEPGGVVFRRAAFEQVGGFDASLSYYTDLDLWLRLLLVGPGRILDAPVQKFRLHGGSLTVENRRRAFQEWRVIFSRYREAEAPSAWALRAHLIGLARNLIHGFANRFL